MGKTRIVIEIESKFTPIKTIDYETGELTDEDVTLEVEKEFHNVIDLEIRQFISEQLEENCFEYDIDYMVEGRDSFKEYGEMNINIKTEEIIEDGSYTN